MTCDEGRPCQRWSAQAVFSALWTLLLIRESYSLNSIKREIAHLCHDEQKPSVAAKEKAPSDPASTTTSTPAPESDPHAQPKPVLSAPGQPMDAFPCEQIPWLRAQHVFILPHSNGCAVCDDVCSWPCLGMAICGNSPGGFVLPSRNHTRQRVLCAVRFPGISRRTLILQPPTSHSRSSPHVCSGPTFPYPAPTHTAFP